MVKQECDPEQHTLKAFNSTYLNETTRRQFLGVDDQLRAVPEGQCETQKNDEPQVSLKNAYDCALFYTPALGFCKVSVISVNPHFHLMSNYAGMSPRQL